MGFKPLFGKEGKGRFSKEADRNYVANCWTITLGLIIILVMTVSYPAWGQSGKPRTLNELAAYTGPDRQKIILDGAKAEGKVLWYTSLSGNYRELVDAFKKKYPEIQIEVYRAGSSDVSQRLLSEAKAGRYLASPSRSSQDAMSCVATLCDVELVSVVAVTFDTRSDKGPATRTISVITNDPRHQQISLTLKGDVKVQVEAAPSPVAFGNVRHGSEQVIYPGRQ